MEKRKRQRIFAQLLYLLYLCTAVYMLFFSESVGRTGYDEYHYNLIPFDTIRRYILYADVVGRKAVILNLLGNIIGFLPIGFFPPLLNTKYRRLHVTVLLAAGLSILVELIQLVTRVGSCDIDDVILNTLGGFLGYLVFLLFMKVRDSVKRLREEGAKQERNGKHHAKIETV